jgi:NADPH:quinone reductase
LDSVQAPIELACHVEEIAPTIREFLTNWDSGPCGSKTAPCRSRTSGLSIDRRRRDRAIVIEKFGGPECLVYKELPEPEPIAGQVVIKVKAFGINHAEMHMRRGEWAEAAEVSGIECVGLVKAGPGGEFPVGAKVAALMGGLGRTINGSYAEYTRAPASNVALIESNLPWEELAAIPETYATAWTCLFRNLEIAQGQTLVIRGATSSFGRAAINLAVNAEVRVIATTRNRERFAVLEKLGADRVELEGPGLSQRIAEAKQIFEEIREAHRVMEANEAHGKMVVVGDA